MYKKYGMRQKRSDFFSGSGSWVGARWWSIILQCEDKAIGPGSVGNWVLLKAFDPGKDIQNALYKPNSDGGLWQSTKKKNYENPGASEYVLTEEHLREKLKKTKTQEKWKRKPEANAKVTSTESRQIPTPERWWQGSREGAQREPGQQQRRFSILAPGLMCAIFYSRK